MSNAGLQNPSSKQKKAAPWLEPYRFKHGKSGNPRGKRHGQVSLAAALKNYLAHGGRMERVVQSLYAAALKGDVGAIKLIAERVDGSLRQAFEAHLTGNMPLIAPEQLNVQILIPPNQRQDRPALIHNNKLLNPGDTSS